MGQPNWGKLKQENRVKDINQPWTAEEEALIDEGVPPEYIREYGNKIKSYEDFEQIKQKEMKKEKAQQVPPFEQLRTMDKSQMMKIADQVDLNVTPDIDRNDLMSKLNKFRKKVEQI